MATIRTRFVNAGSSGGDGTTQALSGSTAAYASLYAWSADRQRDLVAADEIEEVICEGSTADTIQADLSLHASWVTDATHYVSIKAGTSDRAQTKWSTSKYRLSVRSSGGARSFISVIQYLRLDGLQIEADCSNNDAPTRNCIVVHLSPPAVDGSGSYSRVSNCHLRISGASLYSEITPGVSWYGLLYNPSTAGASPVPIIDIYNNIVSFEATGILSWTGDGGVPRGIRAEHRDHNAYIYNNTVVGPWGVGISGDNGSSRLHYLRNNLIHGAETATAENAARCDYNATDLVSLGYTANTNDRVSQTFSFAAVDDFALTGSDSGARDYGLTDPGSGLFNADINGVVRSGVWDIGAHEYVLSTPVPKLVVNGQLITNGRLYV